MLSRIFSGQKTVEAEGFHRGTQEYPQGERLIDPERDELKAEFERRVEEVELASADRINRLDARVRTLSREKSEAGDIRERMERMTKVAPPFVKALLTLVVGFLGIVGEAYYLAPVLQGQGIVEEYQQIFVALVIVATAAILVEMTIHRLFPPAELTLHETSEGEERRHLRRWLPVVMTAALGIFTLSLLAMLGLWRAEELIFGASAEAGEGSSLGRFLSENPTLTKVCVVLLTVALPIAAAWALEWGFRQIHFAWQWRRARRIHLRRGRQLDTTEKRLVAEREKLAKRKAAIDRQREEWTRALEEQYELGRRIRARRLPLWRVILQIAMAAALFLAACLLAMPLIAGWVPDGGMQWMVLVTGWLGLSGLYAARALHAWERPNPRQLYKQQAVIWRDEALRSGPGFSEVEEEPKAIAAAGHAALPSIADRVRLNGAAN